MSLEALSSQIEAEAKAEAKAIIKAAKDQAKGIRSEAEACLLYTSPSPRD